MEKRSLDVDTPKTITHIGLCAGYGGIELGLKRVIPDMRTVALCEIEAFACANLVAKMEAGLMDAAPVWTDLKTFPWESFRDRVDILTGGYPCQPFSAAGKRLGTEDPRHLWPYIASGIRILKPRVCFFENVEGHITLGLSTVISDLEELGYRVAWGIFSAAEVGAPHQRKRMFLFANSMCKRAQFSFKRKQSTEQMFGIKSQTWRTWKTWPIESTVCGSNDGSSNRVDRLRLLGNGVVPATAEKAFRVLFEKLNNCNNQTDMTNNTETVETTEINMTEPTQSIEKAPPEQTYTVSAIAAHFDVSLPTIYRLVEKKLITPINEKNGSLKFTKSNVNEYIRSINIAEL